MLSHSWDLIKRLFNTWRSIIGGILTLISIIFALTDIQILIPNIYLGLIGIGAIIFEVFKIYHEQRTHIEAAQNSAPDFKIVIGESQLAFDEWHNAHWKLNDIGKASLIIEATIQNTRSAATVLDFSITGIETDVPLLQVDSSEDIQIMLYHRETWPRGKKSPVNIPPSAWLTDVNVRAEVNVELQPIEEKLPQLAKAQYFRATLIVSQSDNATGIEQYPIEVALTGYFENKFEERFTNWLRNQSPPRNAPGVPKILSYLKLLWKGSE